MRVVLPLALAAALAGCAASTPEAGASRTAEATMLPRVRTVGVVMDLPAVRGPGVRLYDRMFDFLLDETTPAVVRRLGADTTAFVSDLEIVLDSLTFEIDAERDQLTVGAFLEGRQSLVARVHFEARGGARPARGWASGSTTLPREGGIGWQAYLGALAALADDVAREAGLEAP